VNDAWMAWRSASLTLFWATIEALTRAASLRGMAARELTILHPDKPKDLFAAGYAVFLFEPYWDAWHGYWLAPDASPHLSPEPLFRATDWSAVPWHRVVFKDASYDTREFRAVPLAYARRHLASLPLRQAA
jgi:hypothetical protein